MKRVSFLIACAVLSLSGCDAQKETDSTLSVSTESSSITDEKNAINLAGGRLDKEKKVLKGLEIMKDEKIGGIHLSMPEENVVRVLGEPAKKGTPELSEVDGLYYWGAVYPGLVISYEKKDATESSVSQISSIYIDSNLFRGRTLKGIRIGSKKQEILDVYKNDIDYEWMEQMENLWREKVKEEGAVSEKRQIKVGSVYGGVFFTLSDKDEVESIYIGAGVE